MLQIISIMLTSHFRVGSSDSDTDAKKRKKKKKKKKSSVKRTRTSFMYYHKAMRPSVKEANPGKLLASKRGNAFFPVNHIVQRERNACVPCAIYLRQEFRRNHKTCGRAMESSHARGQGGHCLRLWIVAACQHVRFVHSKLRVLQNGLFSFGLVGVHQVAKAGSRKVSTRTRGGKAVQSAKPVVVVVRKRFGR